MKNCPTCGRSYPPTRKEQVFCSIRCSKMGERNPMFVDGVSESLPRFWRRQVLERDGGCVICGEKSLDAPHRLHAHHLNGRRLFPDQAADVSNGVTLCVSCHRGFHRIYGRLGTAEKFKRYVERKRDALRALEE